MSATEQIDHSVLKTAQDRGLAEILAEAATCIGRPSISQATTLDRLNSLRERLATERFQLAVLGQFKRGKSSCPQCAPRKIGVADRRRAGHGHPDIS